MPRALDGVDDRIVLSIGALGFAFGPGTMAVILKTDVDGNADVILHVGSSDTVDYRMTKAGTDVLRLRCNSSNVDSAFTILASQGWQLVAITKASGTVAPRLHQYIYGTNAWTHEDSASTLANSSAPGTSAYMGSTAAGGSYWDGDIAAAGVWDVVLTDAQIEALAYGLMPWYAVQPKGLWLLDQDTTSQKVPDLTGGGANESSLTGTTVGTSAVPIFSYGHDFIRVQRIFDVPRARLPVIVGQAVARAGLR